jgi:hypothetical protein
LQANPAPKQTAMKPICLRTVLMFFIVITVATPFEFTRKGSSSGLKTGFEVVPVDTEKDCYTPETNHSGENALLPAGTYDRFDPYTLQGKSISTGVLVL